jgi:nitrogenase molybdenum-iron protein alpha/beta subunit
MAKKRDRKQSLPDDEDFWQHQEARLRKNLGQPCCTLSGMCSVLTSIKGNYAVVIHGETDCINSFIHHQGPAVANFYCTNLTEQEVTTGQTRQPLEKCLRLLVDEAQPDAVLVLGTCLIEVIGDRFEDTVSKIAAESSVPMVAMRTSGLKLSSQSDMLDWLFETLAKLPSIESLGSAWRRRAAILGIRVVHSSFERGPDAIQQVLTEYEDLKTPELMDAERSLNLIGLPEFERGYEHELVEIIESLGLEINGCYPYSTSLDDWRCIGDTRTSFVVDRGLYPRLTARLEDFGQRVIEVPLPVGLEQSEKFYRIIAESLDQERLLDKLIAGRIDQARTDLANFRSRHSGLRMAVGLRMLNNYRADQLAYQGLGDVTALGELGLDLTLLVQGPPEEKARQQCADTLKSLGCDLPFEMFPDPWNLSERLGQGNYDVAYLADHSREEAAKASVPMIVSRGLVPLFYGIVLNLKRLDRLLQDSLANGKGQP